MLAQALLERVVFGLALHQAEAPAIVVDHDRDMIRIVERRRAAGPAARGQPVRFRVFIDGQPPRDDHGIDVDAEGNGTVSEQRLYQLIRQRKPVVDRQFDIEFLDPGVEAFAFTFG